jgi:hypothetical protein
MKEITVSNYQGGYRVAGHTFIDAGAAEDVGTSTIVAQYDKITFSLDADVDSTLTVKFQGSISETAPDFTDAQASDNQWDYIEVVDLEDGTAIDGDTGVAITGAQDHRLFQANVDGLVHVNAIITAHTGGAVTVKGVAFNHSK